MKHARLQSTLIRALIFVGAATAIITVPACNSPRRLETLGGPMVESAKTLKKEEPKKDEVTLPVKIEKVPKPKDVGKVEKIPKSSDKAKKGLELKSIDPPPDYEIDIKMELTPHKPKKEDYH